MEIIKKIFKDKFAKTAFIVLALMYTVILFADFISPYSNTYSNRDLSYAPPSKIYTINEKGKLSFPYTYNEFCLRRYKEIMSPPKGEPIMFDFINHRRKIGFVKEEK